MNIIHKTLAATTGLVLSLGFALPVAALNVDGTVNSATQGTVTVGNAGAITNVNADVDVGVGVGARSSGTTSGSGAQGSGSADVTATTEAGASVTIQPLIVITRADVVGNAAVSGSVSPASVKTNADLRGFIAAQVQADENVSRVEASADNVAVTYKQPAKLFGFIPVTIDATATVDASGNVTVFYPWYAFLMVTNKSDLEARIEERVSADANLDASTNADASASAEAAARLSAEAQAKIVAAVKAAMQAQLEAELNASASGNVSVQ